MSFRSPLTDCTHATLQAMNCLPPTPHSTAKLMKNAAMANLTATATAAAAAAAAGIQHVTTAVTITTYTHNPYIAGLIDPSEGSSADEYDAIYSGAATTGSPLYGCTGSGGMLSRQQSSSVMGLSTAGAESTLSSPYPRRSTSYTAATAYLNNNNNNNAMMQQQQPGGEGSVMGSPVERVLFQASSSSRGSSRGGTTSSVMMPFEEMHHHHNNNNNNNNNHHHTATAAHSPLNGLYSPSLRRSVPGSPAPLCSSVVSSPLRMAAAAALPPFAASGVSVEVRVQLRAAEEVFLAQDTGRIFGLGLLSTAAAAATEDEEEKENAQEEEEELAAALLNRYVVVEGDRGEDMGQIVEVLAIHRRHPHPGVAHIKKVLRASTTEDMAKFASLEKEEKEALEVCIKSIKKVGLNVDICIEGAVFQFDKKKLTIQYTADAYVDFTQLTRILHNCYKCRIWMDQLNRSTALQESKKNRTKAPQQQQAGSNQHHSHAGSLSSHHINNNNNSNKRRSPVSGGAVHKSSSTSSK